MFAFKEFIPGSNLGKLKSIVITSSDIPRYTPEYQIVNNSQENEISKLFMTQK